MGRLLPMDCPHGLTVDWGDFGPCQDCSTDHEDGEDRCPNIVECEKCQQEAMEAQVRPFVELRDRMRSAHADLEGLADRSRSKSEARRLRYKAQGVGVALSYVEDAIRFMRSGTPLSGSSKADQ